MYVYDMKFYTAGKYQKKDVHGHSTVAPVSPEKRKKEKRRKEKEKEKEKRDINSKMNKTKKSRKLPHYPIKPCLARHGIQKKKQRDQKTKSDKTQQEKANSSPVFNSDPII